MKTWMKNLILSILAIIAVIIFHEQIWQGILYVLSFFLVLIIDFVSLLVVIGVGMYIILDLLS